VCWAHGDMGELCKTVELIKVPFFGQTHAWWTQETLYCPGHSTERDIFDEDIVKYRDYANMCVCVCVRDAFVCRR